MTKCLAREVDGGVFCGLQFEGMALVAGKTEQEREVVGHIASIVRRQKMNTAAQLCLLFIQSGIPAHGMISAWLEWVFPL